MWTDQQNPLFWYFFLKFQDSDVEEDYFAEILKDDIIKLDETSLSATPDSLHMIASMSDAERRSQLPRQQNIPNVSHFQGTVNRGIKLRRSKADILCAKASEPVVGEISIEKLSSPKSEESPKYLLSLFSLSTANLRLIYFTFVILTLLALFLSFVGGSKPVKYFKYATFYKNFWQWMNI